MSGKNISTISEEDWLLAPIHRFFRYFRDSSFILELSIAGIRSQSIQAEIYRNPTLHQEFLTKIDQLKRSDTSINAKEIQETIDTHRRISSFADAETARGCPVIRSHTLVAFWGALEVFVDDIILAWIGHNPELLKEETFQKVKLPVSDFATLDREDFLMSVLEEAKTQTKTNLLKGINKFEGLLSLVGLDGPVDKRIKVDLYITQQIRNVIVHKGAVADKRFVNACPMLEMKVGDKISLPKEQYERWRDSIEDYLLCIIQRAVYKAGYLPVNNEDLVKAIVPSFDLENFD